MKEFGPQGVGEWHIPGAPFGSANVCSISLTISTHVLKCIEVLNVLNVFEIHASKLQQLIEKA